MPETCRNRKNDKYFSPMVENDKPKCTGDCNIQSMYVTFFNYHKCLTCGWSSDDDATPPVKPENDKKIDNQYIDKMDNQLSNESAFDENLNKISELYENGKKALHNWEYKLPGESERQYADQLYAILREMRDIACLNLKRTHAIGEN